MVAKGKAEPTETGTAVNGVVNGTVTTNGVDDKEHQASDAVTAPAADLPPPVLIEDVAAWKAGLRISEAPTPIEDIKRFEEIESKL